MIHLDLLSVTVCLHKQIEKREVKYNNFFPFRHAGRNEALTTRTNRQYFTAMKKMMPHGKNMFILITKQQLKRL